MATGITHRTIIMLLMLVSAALLRAQPNDPPRNPSMINLPEIGKMIGTLSPCQSESWSELYGHEIYPLGDVSGDSLADWAILHQRCDTMVNGHPPTEVLIYHGVRGGLPDVRNGVRLGPTEVLSDTRILAVGDWDHDSKPDICAYSLIYHDSSFGVDPAKHIGVGWVVIYWNDGKGDFSLLDTTRLFPSANTDFEAYLGGSEFFDAENTKDLLLCGGGYGFHNGRVVTLPREFIFRGHDKQRWGRNGIPSTPDWQWWNAPSTVDGLHVIDQDNDGHADVVHYCNTCAPATVSVLYGNSSGGLPDTSELQTLDIQTVAGGRYALFEDVTGDHRPELLVGCADSNLVKIFAGVRGQRIIDQYGPGDESRDTATTRWWRKPWARLQEPHAIDPNWFQADLPLYDLGDGNLDGIGDIWIHSWPYILGYTSGKYLDSLIDAQIDSRPGELVQAVRLGDINGSGVDAIAISYDTDLTPPASFPGGIKFVQPSLDVPDFGGTVRRLPDGTGTSSVRLEERSRVVGDMLDLQAMPNPASGELRICWNEGAGTGEATIRVSDVLGGRVATWSVPARDGTTTWNTVGSFGGVYFITVSVGTLTSTTRVVVSP